MQQSGVRKWLRIKENPGGNLQFFVKNSVLSVKVQEQAIVSANPSRILN